MSRIIEQIPTAFRAKNESEDEQDSVFVDDLFSDVPCRNYLPVKSCRLSVSGNSARLGSIHLSETIRKKTPPIRRKDARDQTDPFKKYKVPDLVISCIFSNLRKRDLCSAMQVCKKFSVVGRASHGWYVTDCGDRPVSEYSLAAIMKTKVRILRLAGAKADPDVCIPDDVLRECMFVPSRLELLDLSRANLTHRQLMIVLRPCRKLQCLSLEGNLLDDNVASCVAENKGLVQLDISMTHGITKIGAYNIFHNCQKLEHVNASWCGLDTEILHVIFENISTKIRKLNLSGSDRDHGLNDEHIQMLTNACPNITDIDLSDNTELERETISLILNNLPSLHTISLNRCYGIDPNAIIRLNDLNSLHYLNVHGCITDGNMKLFVEMCNRLKVNRQYFNFTAKPVNGTANTMQIWGHSLKEKVQ